MKCNHCGKEITDSAVFCPYCGTNNKTDETTVTYCRNCGAKMTKGADFCLSCGFGAGKGNHYCANCGAQTTEGQDVCVKCGRIISRSVTASAAGKHNRGTVGNAEDLVRILKKNNEITNVRGESNSRVHVKSSANHTNIKWPGNRSMIFDFIKSHLSWIGALLGVIALILYAARGSIFRGIVNTMVLDFENETDLSSVLELENGYGRSLESMASKLHQFYILPLVGLVLSLIGLALLVVTIIRIRQFDLAVIIGLVVAFIGFVLCLRVVSITATSVGGMTNYFKEYEMVIQKIASIREMQGLYQ